MKDTTERYYLQYNFFIDEAIWPNLYDFEDWLAKALEAINAEGVMINNIKGFSSFQRTVHIKKREIPLAPPTAPAPNNHGLAPSMQIKAVAKDIPQKRFRRRFLVKSNG